MRTITIHLGSNGPNVSVRETETPDTWELEWTGAMEQRHARRMLKAADNAVLQNGGERLVFTCSADQEILRAELDKWPASMVSRTGDRYAIELITPAKDGLIHDDYDFRTPLQRITCPTCVERFAKSRSRRREEAFGKGEGPKEIAKHSQLIAEAYVRLAEIEENLEIMNGTASQQKQHDLNSRVLEATESKKKTLMVRKRCHRRTVGPDLTDNPQSDWRFECLMQDRNGNCVRDPEQRIRRAGPMPGGDRPRQGSPLMGTVILDGYQTPTEAHQVRAACS